MDQTQGELSPRAYPVKPVNGPYLAGLLGEGELVRKRNESALVVTPLLIEPVTGRIADANPAALEYYGYDYSRSDPGGFVRHSG